jgi:Uma2 family endonuclease
MAVHGVVLTYEDYAAMPSDGRRFELHEGEIAMRPAPDLWHQDAVLELAQSLGGHIKSRGLGKLYLAPTDLILAPSTVVQPDLIFVASDRLSILTDRAVEGTPTLVIEILSPGTERVDLTVKFQLYAPFGIPYYWIVSRDTRSIRCYRLEDGAYVLDGELCEDDKRSLAPFTDLTLDVGALFG